MTPLHSTPTTDPKAQVVRDAILAMADTTTNHRVLTAAMQLVAHMSDEEARRLGRFLRV